MHRSASGRASGRRLTARPPAALPPRRAHRRAWKAAPACALGFIGATWPSTDDDDRGRFWPSTSTRFPIDPDEVVAADHAAAAAEQPFEIGLRRRTISAHRRGGAIGRARCPVLFVTLDLVLFHGCGFRIGQHQPVAELRGPIDGSNRGDVERTLEVGAPVRHARDSRRFRHPGRRLRRGPVRCEPATAAAATKHPIKRDKRVRMS
jgi:hypothetical protein